MASTGEYAAYKFWDIISKKIWLKEDMHKMHYYV